MTPGRLAVGTAGGLFELDPTAPPARRAEPPGGAPVAFGGRTITGLARDGAAWWALVDRRAVYRRAGEEAWREVARLETAIATCLGVGAGSVWVGAVGARLYRLASTGLVPVEAFDAVAGRETWHTPWGDPPDTRSIAGGCDGVLYVNVHVGGVPRSADGGRSWEPSVAVEADVHQVATHPSWPGLVAVAAAVGLGVSRDGGRTWQFASAGLHAPYARAVAVTEEAVFLAASTGPRARRGALYRGSLDRPGPLTRCARGLPRWFPGNVETGCVAALGPVVAVGTGDGRVFVSRDGGRRWDLRRRGLPPVRCLALG